MDYIKNLFFYKTKLQIEDSPKSNLSVNLLNLPNELLDMIFGFLENDLKNLRDLRLVCSRFKIIVNHSKRKLEIFNLIFKGIYFSSKCNQNIDLYTSFFIKEKFLKEKISYIYFKSLNNLKYGISNHIHEKYKNFLIFPNKTKNFFFKTVTAIERASQLGHIKILQLLLKESSINETAT